jgi:hypothetical protein
MIYPPISGRWLQAVVVSLDDACGYNYELRSRHRQRRGGSRQHHHLHDESVDRQMAIAGITSLRAA